MQTFHLEELKFHLKFNNKIQHLLTGEAVKLYKKDSLLKAELILLNKTIKSNITVKIIKTEMKEFAHFQGKNLGVHYNSLLNLLCIGKINGLNGGSMNYEPQSIDEIFQVLKRRIEDNINPFVAEDISKLLNSIEVINNQFVVPEMNYLPDEIINDILGIQARVNINNATENLFEERERILRLESFNFKGSYWECFNIILELECMRKLSTSNSKKIIMYIKSKEKTDDIRRLIEGYGLDKKIIQEISLKENQIKQKYAKLLQNYNKIRNWKLNTWINFIIENYPKELTGLFSLLDKNNDYFIKKTLRVIEYKTQDTIIDLKIKSFKIESKTSPKKEISIFIELENKDKVEIVNNSSETILSHKEFYTAGLISYIQENNKNEVTITEESNDILPGKYIVIKKNKEYELRCETKTYSIRIKKT